jgi:type II secretory pathway predicted ATPase ExeA
MSELDRHARAWGLKHVPFTQLTDSDWLDTPSSLRAKQLLDQTSVLRGVLLISGPNGVGKSVLLSRWIRQLDSRLFHSISLTQATLTGSSLLAALVTKLGKRPGYRRERNLDEIEQFLREHERHHCILVLDEAQNYSLEALEELRLLLGLNLPSQPTFALVLIGDEYLMGSLQLRPHRALYSRLSAQCQLQPWTPSEVAQYLHKGFEAAGLPQSPWDSAAVDLLARASGGLPRTLCLLARASWIAAATLSNHQRIGVDAVQQAIEQIPCLPGLKHPTATGEPPRP